MRSDHRPSIYRLKGSALSAGTRYDVPPGFGVAVALNKDGSVYDYIGTWETAQTLANEGYRIDVLTGDGHLTRDELQAMVDRELADAVDCFGPERQK